MADKKVYKFKHVRVVTPVGSAANAYLPPGKPDSYQGGPEKYKTTIILGGDFDRSKIDAAASAVAAQVWPGVAFEKLNILVKDGDEYYNDADSDERKEKRAHYRGKFFITATCSAKYAPDMRGPDRAPLPAGIEVRGGDKIALALDVLPSDVPVKRTITFRLLAVQLVEKMSSSSGAAGDMFDDVGPGFGSGGAVSAGPAGGEDEDENPF